jgi:hypothetical protein
MKKSFLGRAVPVIALSLLAGAANAHPPHGKKIDTNGDEVVDFAELQAVRPEMTLEHFNAMDKNSDGQLVRDELIAAHRDEWIKHVDSDGDGAISLEEMEAIRPPHLDPAERFNQFDSDGDGKLSQDELRAMHEEMNKHMPEFVKFRKGSPAADEESDQ